MEFTDLEALGKADGDVDDAESGLSLVYSAASSGHTEQLKLSIRQDPTLLERPDDHGAVLLMHAVHAEQMGSLKLLVKMGASLNVQSRDGQTALAMAAHQGWYDGVLVLLRNGATRGIRDKNNRSPLHCSTCNNDTRVLARLLHNVTENDVNHTDNEGMSALHWAAFHKQPNHMTLLLSKDADVTLQDSDGMTALHWAAENGCVACCQLLSSHPHSGDLLNQPDHVGKTALHCAAAAGCDDAVRALASFDQCDVEAQDAEERTALHWAAAAASADVVRTLLELGASRAPVDVEGNPPLAYATSAGNTECVRLLEFGLATGADDNHDGKTNTMKSGNDRRNALEFFVDTFERRNSESFTEELRIPSGDINDEVGGTQQTIDWSRECCTDKLDSRSGVVSARNDAVSKRSIDIVSSIDSLAPSSRHERNAALKRTEPVSPRRSESCSLSARTTLPPSDQSGSLSCSSPPEGDRRDITDEGESRNDESSKLLKRTVLMASSSGSSISTTSSDGDSSVKGGKLAPLKGPIPPKPGAVTPCLLNKRLGLLRSERTGIDRPPTPPGWDCFVDEPQGIPAPRTERLLFAPNRRNKTKVRATLSRVGNGCTRSLDKSEARRACAEPSPPADGRGRAGNKTDKPQRKQDDLEAYRQQRVSMDKDMRYLLH